MTSTTPALAFALALFSAAGAAGASTAFEQRIYSAPLAHQLLSPAGPAEAVHYFRFESVTGTKALRELAHNLKSSIALCVQMKTRRGERANPPSQFPDYAHNARYDHYFARNRNIQYRHGYAATMNIADCSLVETELFTATLRSSHGVCEIDLIGKTAKGACDARAHASAMAAPASLPPTRSASRYSPAALAVARAAMQQVGAADVPQTTEAGAAPDAPRTGGARKRILGIECVVTAMPGGAGCVSVGGSFTPYGGIGTGEQRGMLLEASGRGGVIEAVEAKLDAQLGSGVFAPHVAGGYRLIPAGGQ